MVHQTSTTSASPYRNGFTSGGVAEPAEDHFYLLRMHEILSAFSVRAPPYPPTQVTPHVYMGSLRNAEDTESLRQLGITHVLNMAGTRRFDLRRSPYAEETGIKDYLMIPAEDHDDYDMMQHFSSAFDFIDSARKAGGCAFVHCNLGVNRCGCIVTGYLMYDQRMPILEATQHIKSKRLFVLCNKNFRHQLVRYARIKGLLDHVKESMIKEVIERATIKQKNRLQKGEANDETKSSRPSRRYISRKHNSDTAVVLSHFQKDCNGLDPHAKDAETKENGNANHSFGSKKLEKASRDLHETEYNSTYAGRKYEDRDDDLDFSPKYNFTYSGGICYNKPSGTNVYPTIATPGRRKRFISRKDKHDSIDEYLEKATSSHETNGSSYSGSSTKKPESSTSSRNYSWLSDYSHDDDVHDRHYPTASSYSSYKPLSYSHQTNLSSGYNSSSTARYSTASLTPFSPRKYTDPPSSYTRYEPLTSASYKPSASFSSGSSASPFVSKTWSGSTYAATRSYGHSGASSVISTLPKSRLTRIGSYHQTVLAHHSPSTRLSAHTTQYLSPLL